MYSLDFIHVVIKTYHMRTSLNFTVAQIVSFYNISKQSIYNWLNNNLLISGNKRLFNRSTKPSHKLHISYVTNYVKKFPQFSIKTLLKNLIFLFGFAVSRQTICNILKRNNITRKRVQINKYPHSVDKYESCLNQLRSQLKSRKNRIISIDETGINLNSPSNYG